MAKRCPSDFYSSLSLHEEVFDELHEGVTCVMAIMNQTMVEVWTDDISANAPREKYLREKLAAALRPYVNARIVSLVTYSSWDDGPKRQYLLAVIEYGSS